VTAGFTRKAVREAAVPGTLEVHDIRTEGRTMPRTLPRTIAPRSLRALAATAALVAPLALLAGTTGTAHASGAADRARMVDAKSQAAPATFIRGRTVNAGNGNPIAGVIVTVRDIITLEVIDKDVTDAMGAYRFTGLTEEEYAIKFNGRGQGFETGFLGCGNRVVPTWGEACSHGTGRLGPARMDAI